MEDGVDLGVPLHLELLTELLADSGLDSFKDVGEDTEVGGVVLVVVAALEDTGADKAGVPAVHVSTADIRGGVVTDHVDVLGEVVLVVDLFHPGAEDLVGVGVGGLFRLSVDNTLKFLTGQGLVLGLDGDTEGTLGKTGGALVVGREDQVTLGEVDRDAVGDGVLGTSQHLAVVSEQQIDDQLEVGLVVARVGEDKDSVELDLGEVAGLGLGAVLLCEHSPGRDGRVPSEDILGVDNVLEAVVLSDLADFLAFTTTNQNSVVVFRQGLHGGVGLDELVGGDGRFENLTELRATGSLGLTTTIGQENVGNLDAELVVAVEHAEGLLGFWDGLVTVSQDTINVKGERHVLRSGNLLLGHVLDLRGQDVAGNASGISSNGGGQAGDTGRAGDGERSAKGVARAAAVPSGGGQAQVVHESSGIADRASGSRDLNGVSSVVGDWQ